MTKIAILQSSYIPWKGYFDIINSVDEFIWYDDVQFTRRDWRSRNQIKTPNGLQWLTVSCFKKGKPLIQDVKLSDHGWQKKHWRTISQNYSKSPYFKLYKDFFEELYLGRQWEYLSTMNQAFIEKISKELLGIKTKFLNSSNYNALGSKQEKLIDLIEKVGGDVYLSGPSAKNYINEFEFQKRDIKLEWMDYSNYPTYPQLYNEFQHTVAVLDLLFNTGENASWYIWGWRDDV